MQRCGGAAVGGAAVLLEFWKSVIIIREMHRLGMLVVVVTFGRMIALVRMKGRHDNEDGN